MEVILLERIRSLGNAGDVVTVRNGYARNFLLPGKKVLRATKENLASVEARKEEIAQSNLVIKQAAQENIEKFKDLAIIMIRQAGEDGKLYGSITAKEIADFIKTERNVEISASDIVIHSKIKSIGTHSISIHLHADIVFDAVVIAARTMEEANQALAEPAAVFAE